MRLRAGYDAGQLSALEAEMDADAFLGVTRRLIDEHSNAK